ncbi:MAG TPA: LysR family transcriptional regulator [Polyangiaceae bacterium]|jgi:DNA-binding transcriptional LysR family regulator|nr:LysR family transcriptional regulator [Polyangiaceae bacterium]
MELRHLRYFVAVAEELHFGRAAERLGIAQPPLSRQIQALERELGFELFDRSRRRIELRAAGVVLLERARDVLARLEEAEREARRASLGKRGRVAVGYPSSLAYTGLVGLLRAFRAEYPDVELVVRELPLSGQLEGLKNGELDVGFVRGPVDDRDLSHECVRREPLMLALPADHPLSRRRRLTLASVAREPFVFFPRARAPAFFDLLLGLCQKAGFTPQIRHEAPQVDVLSMVGAGFGISIMPASVREIRRADVVFRPFAGAPLTELLLAWRTGEGSPSRQAFIDVVRRVGLRLTSA